MIKNKRKIKSVLLLWYSIDLNYGDYLIYKTVKGYLKEWGVEVHDMDVGLPFWDIARRAKRSDFLWFIGGGIIERGIPNIIRNFRKFHWLSKKIKYGVTGLSIGEFDYSDKKKSLQYWVNNASFFYSRDTYTALELNRLAESDKVIDGVDVVFGNRELYSMAAGDNGLVGISLRELPYVDLSGEFKWKEWENELHRILGNDIVGVPDQHDYSKHIDIPVAADYKPENVTKLLQQISYTISMRYHVILVAAVMGKISIPIAYCPKVSRLAEQLGISDLELEIHDYKDLERVIVLYNTQKEKYKLIVQKNVNEMHNRAVKMFLEVKTIIKGES